MTTSFIIIGIVLFALTYFSKRRFGLLGFGLIAGTIISSNWALPTTSLLQVQGVNLSFPPLSIVVAGVLIILPALLLLLVGPIYHKKWQKVACSILFTVFSLDLTASMVYQQAPALVDSHFFVAAAGLQPLLLVVIVVLSLSDIIVHYLPGNKKTAHK